MSQSIISFRVRATGPDLHLHVFLDSKEIHHFSPSDNDYQVTVDVNDDIEQEHLLELVMSGKSMSHTSIDNFGKIIQDRVIEISHICLDEIELGHTFSTCATYHHDFNGTGEPTQEQFYGTMGCNGVVKFRFSTPVYLWLLENM